MTRSSTARVLRAGAVAAVVSGAPSTAHALATGRDPLESTRAAGSLALPRERREARLLAAGVPVHLAVSLLWAVVLARTLPHRRPVAEGLAAGIAIHLLDYGAVGRRVPRLRALPTVPQLADHLAYGVVVSVLTAR